jgi:hypothetical protein
VNPKKSYVVKTAQIIRRSLFYIILRYCFSVQKNCVKLAVWPLLVPSVHTSMVVLSLVEKPATVGVYKHRSACVSPGRWVETCKTCAHLCRRCRSQSWWGSGRRTGWSRRRPPHSADLTGSSWVRLSIAPHIFSWTSISRKISDPLMQAGVSIILGYTVIKAMTNYGVSDGVNGDYIQHLGI